MGLVYKICSYSNFKKEPLSIGNSYSGLLSNLYGKYYEVDISDVASVELSLSFNDYSFKPHIYIFSYNGYSKDLFLNQALNRKLVL